MLAEHTRPTAERLQQPAGLFVHILRRPVVDDEQFVVGQRLSRNRIQSRRENAGAVSIARQTLTDYELLVVDDGSPEDVHEE